MSTDANKEPDLFVTEDLDGTATVDLPEDMDLHDGGDVSLRQAGTPEEQDEADARAEAAEIAATGDIDPEAEAMRAAKRNKRKARKEYHRQVATEKDVRLQNLQRQQQKKE